MVQLLKERRIELGKEIDEVAEITRIKESYLKAIEEEGFSKLPIEVYTKGYIREYAKYLGVNPEEIIARYDNYLYEKKGIKGKRPLTDTASKSLDTGVTAEQTSHKGTVETTVAANQIPAYETGSPFPKKALLALPVLAIIVAMYFLVPQGEKSPEMPLKPPVAVQEAPLAPPTSAVQPDNQPVPQTTPQAPAANEADKTKTAKTEMKPETRPVTGTDAKPKDEKAAAAGQKKKYSLDIKATDKVWLQVIIDGSEKKEMTLNIGDRIVYGANESFNILVGNAAGVNLKYNDKNFGALGEKGQVVRLNLPEMNSPQVITIKKKDPETSTPQTSNQVNQ